MKIKILKFKNQIAALMAVFILGSCSLVSAAPVSPKPQTSSVDILARSVSRRQFSFAGGQPQQTLSASLPSNTQGSGNWAGYIDTPASGDQYTSVSGSWVVPNITARQADAAAAQWIGLGGVSSEDLLQMGTIEEIQNGKPVAEVFWEQLPSPAQIVMTVPAGSTISATISPATNSDLTWNLSFTVNGKTQTKTIPAVTLSSSYAQGIGTSAEWISEDPSATDSQLYPLASMGTVTYTNALADNLPLKSAGNVQPVAMVSSQGNVLIAPSVLNSDGKSFSTSTPSSAGSPNITSPNTNGIRPKGKARFPLSRQRISWGFSFWGF